MIEASDVTFPNNIVMVLKESLLTIDPPAVGYDGLPVFARSIRKTDPIQCIGVTAVLWVPELESEEMTGIDGRVGTTINNYLIGVQTFVKHSNEEDALQISATLAGLVKSKLTVDNTVRQALGALTSTEFGYTERFTRGLVTGQRFISNELNGWFLHLSNLEFQVQTEISA